MKKRKRAPGGGRKPQGEFQNLTAVMSLRMPQDLRDQLERARKASRRTLSQELIARASASFERDRDQSRDRALRAFCFLFSELVQAICPRDFPDERILDWRFDPWLFQAFRLAVAKLLDRFQPNGEMKLPEFWQVIRDAPDIGGLPPMKAEREQMTQSPEAMADYAVQRILSDFADPQQVKRWYREWKRPEEASDPYVQRVLDYQIKEWGTTYYGMTDAQRDLAPRQKSQGGKQ
jgi:hypothetical protein